MSIKDEMDDILDDRCVFGMDLGTSKSLVAYKDGRAAPPKVANYQGACRGGMPMLFWRDADGREWVGDQVDAKNGLVEDPAGVCRSVKMKLEQTGILLNGHSYTPQYITVQLAKRLLEISREVLDQEFVEMDFGEIVAGVPVVFSAAAKGEMQMLLSRAAGGKSVRLMPEPVLAALTNDYYTRKKGRKPMKTLVVDVGGGTTDVVLLIPTGDPDEPYTVENPKGLAEAGDKMDEALEALAMSKLRGAPGTLNMQLMEDPEHHARRRFREELRKAKESLSEEESYTLSVVDFAGGNAVLRLTRSEYERRIRPLVTRITDLAAEVLDGCALGDRPDIEILMVGGATYTPLLERMLKARFSWLPEGRIMRRFPEKAVALGAAVFAERPQLVKPKVSYGYGVNTYTTDGRKEVVEVLIPANAQLPARFTASYSTLNQNQQFVRFCVYEVPDARSKQVLDMEGARKTEYSIRHSFPAPVPKDTPLKLTGELTDSGTLKLTVEDYLPGTTPSSKVITMCDTVMSR